MPRSRSSKRRTAGGRADFDSITLAVMLVVAPQLAGGRPGWAVAVIAVLAGSAVLSVGLRAGKRVVPSFRASLPIAAALAVLAWTAISCLPLPFNVASWVDPRGTADAVDNAALLGSAPPAWWTLARSPWPAVEQVLVGLALVSALVAGWWHACLGKRELIVRWAAISSIAIAVSAIAHTLAGASTVYGIYTPLIPATLTSPLVNENHLAGFLAMALPLLIVLGAESEDSRVRAAWWTGAAFVVCVCVLAISRGGIVGLAAGLLVLVVLRYRNRDPRERGQSWSWLIAGCALLLGVGVAGTVAFDALRQDASDTNLDKVRLAIRGLDLVAQSPWVGVGRGGFSEAFVRVLGTVERVEQPENFVIQWMSEWGAPMALVLMLSLGDGWRRAARTSSLLQMGALAACASIAVHELVDFATERVGVGVVVAALIGAALASSRADDATPGSRGWGRALPLGLGAAAMITALLIGPGLGDRRVRELQERLVAALAERDDAAFDATLSRAMALHPSEPVFPMLGAHARVARGQPDVGRWLNRAMTLAPGWAGPHVTAARWLASHGAYGQAWLEVREAERRHDLSGGAIACAVAERGRAVDEALRIFATQPDVLDRISACPGLPTELASRIDVALLSTPLSGPRLRIARRAIADGHCQEAIDVLAPAVGEDPMVILRLGAAYRQCDRPLETISLFTAHPIEPWASGEADSVLATAHADVGDADAMRADLERARGAAHGSGTRIAAVLILLGGLEHQLSNDGRAVRAYEEAARLDPESGALSRVAALFEQLGDRAHAYRAWSEVCRHDGPDSAGCVSAAALRGGG